MKLKGKDWFSKFFSDPDPMYIIAGVFYDAKNHYFYVDITGGKREFGESPAESAIRETEEEIAFSIKQVCHENNLHSEIDHLAKDDKMKMQFFSLNLNTK